MIPWNEIKTEYITTNTSYRKLAKKYGVHHNMIAKKSQAEGWIQQRRQTSDKIVTDVTNCLADDMVEWMLQAANAYKNAIAKADYEIANNPKCIGTVLMNTVTAVNSAVSSLRDIYNIPTPAEAESRRIAAERLNLDKVKANVDGEDKAITVVIAKEAEEWSK